MDVSPLAGNVRIQNHLSHITRGAELSHAYLVAGDEDWGQGAVVTLLAAGALCQGENIPCGRCAHCKKIALGVHPDVIHVTGEEGKPIPVERVRQMRSDSYVRPNEGNRKIYILHQAHRMNHSAQNVLLKLLEDGPPYAMFLLLADNEQAMLATIRSRCECLSLTPRVKEITHPLVDTMVGAIVAGDELALLTATISMEKMKREEQEQLFDGLLLALTRAIGQGNDQIHLLRGAALCRTLRGGLYVNANPGQLGGWLCGGIFSSQPLN